MENPVPIEYRENYHGAPESPKDGRDIIVGVDVVITPDPNAPSFEQGFDNEVKYGKLKREHQGASLSCTGQGVSKYLEMLNLIETKKIEDLSAKFPYSLVSLAGGGAYIRDAMLVPVNKGCATETLVPSYEGGNPPSEAFMTDKSGLTAQVYDGAMKFRAKKLVFLPVSDTLTAADWENIRQIIWQFGGFVSGYTGHCMYAVAYGMKDGRKFIKFANSYGEGSDQFYYGEQRLYDISALIDLPNPPDKINMAKLYRDPANTDEVYALNNSKRSHVANAYSLEQGALLGSWLWQAGDEIPVAPQSVWDATEEIAESVFSPRD